MRGSMDPGFITFPATRLNTRETDREREREKERERERERILAEAIRVDLKYVPPNLIEL